MPLGNLGQLNSLEGKIGARTLGLLFFLKVSLYVLLEGDLGFPALTGEQVGHLVITASEYGTSELNRELVK